MSGTPGMPRRRRLAKVSIDQDAGSTDIGMTVPAGERDLGLPERRSRIGRTPTKLNEQASRRFGAGPPNDVAHTLKREPRKPNRHKRGDHSFGKGETDPIVGSISDERLWKRGKLVSFKHVREVTVPALNVTSRPPQNSCR